MNKLFTKIATLSVGLAMAIGVGVAIGGREARVANAASTTYTFTSKSWADSTNSWSSDNDGGQLTSGQGVQVTTGSTGAGAHTKNAINNISEIEFTYCTNASKGAGSISVTVGDNAAKTYSVTKTGGTTARTTTQTYSPVQSGVVTFTVTCTTNSIYIASIKITTAAQDYTVTYNGNGNTSGSVPTDSTKYPSSGTGTCTVLGNTGNLEKTDYNFIGWNTDKDATTAQYVAGNTFTVAGNTTLYAIWQETDHISPKSDLFNVFAGKTIDLRECVTYGGPGALSFSVDANEFVSIAVDGYTLNGNKEGGPVQITANKGSASTTLNVSCTPAPKVYTIVPQHNDETDSSTAFTTFSTQSYAYDSNAIESSSGSKIYNGAGNTIKIGTSSSAGSITISLKNIAQYVTSVVVNAKQYSSDSNKISITPSGGSAITADPDTNLGSTSTDYTFTVTGNSCKSFTLSTTNTKRAYINSISIYYGQIDPVAMTLTAANNKTTITSLSATLQLTATGYSDNAKTNPIAGLNFTYSSATEAVATVNSSGLVTPVATGTSVITARYSESLYATITIKVLLVSVDLVDSSSDLELGDEGAFTYSFSSESLKPATITSVVWSSNNDGVITVSSDGTFEAAATGSSTISVVVTDGDGYVYNTSKVFTVVDTKVNPTHISVTESSGVVAYIGTNSSLHITVLGDGDVPATNQNVNCVSSNSDILTVTSEGVITPVGRGTATVTITDEGGLCSAVLINVRVRRTVLGDAKVMGVLTAPSTATDASDISEYFVTQNDYDAPDSVIQSGGYTDRAGYFRIAASKSSGSISVEYSSLEISKIVVVGKHYSSGKADPTVSGALASNEFGNDDTEVTFTFSALVNSFELLASNGNQFCCKSITVYGKKTDESQSTKSQAVYSFEESYMHMEEYIGDETYNETRCTTNYTAAKAAFNELLPEQRTLFLENEAFADSAERLLKWAKANGDSLNSQKQFSSVANPILLASKNTSAVIIIVVISAISVAAIGGYFLFRKKKED